ncbi:hypothetical protein [Yinghuangia seranimata]|uniref:hypothetical protein n=1 Tax=Yinghuangia seranimata TaxID=408067 RepID=UPI00248ACD01|nr:hypothetical protein [Yinghuangia seranimata]MDI2128754.1 hypothetical protein [Yinghuangia seranimata]
MASDVTVAFELAGLCSPLVTYGVWRVRYLVGLAPEERAGLRLARRAERTWVELAQSLGLKWEEPTAGKRDFRWMSDPRLPQGRMPAVEVPKFRARPIAGGFTARVGTLPGIGLAEVQKQAEHLRNAWRCERVTVEQDVPGVLKVRAVLTDPLTEPYVPERRTSWA